MSLIKLNLQTNLELTNARDALVTKNSHTTKSKNCQITVNLDWRQQKVKKERKNMTIIIIKKKNSRTKY